MSGDLEDFLKRAAQRRAQKQQQQGGMSRPSAPPRRSPEYTDSRQERQIRQQVEQPIPVAEPIEPIDPLAEKRRKLKEAKRRAKEARESISAHQRRSEPEIIEDASAMILQGGNPAEQLLDLIQRPGGIQQAFLLREILDRPEDRWK